VLHYPKIEMSLFGRTVSFDSIAAAVETVNFVLHPIEIPKWRYK